MESIETEVVIVGAGPTGLTLAYELALAGVETLVLEKLTERLQQVKGGAIQPRTAEMLELRGLLEPMLRRAMPRGPVGGHFAMLPVPLDNTVWDTRFPSPIGLPQWEIEEVLEERATALGARIRRGAAVTALDADDDGVSVTADGGTRARARYAVACDGGHSTLRKKLGMPFPGRSGTYLAVLADIRLSSVSELVPRESGHISTLTRRANDYWAMLVPLRDDRYRLTYGYYGSEERPEATRDTPVTEAEISAALRAVYGAETVLGGVDNASRFSDATRQVERYRTGRVLFAGDAAHIHPPLGGQGLNLGVQDAFNLGWKLAATLRGRAPAGLLDSYHAERHPVAAGVLRHTSAQRLLADVRPDSEDAAALRDIFIDLMRLPDTNRYLAGLMSGLALRYEIPGARHPLAGQRVPDAELVTASGTARLSSFFGAGHAVLLDVSGLVPDGVRLPGHLDLVRAKSPADLGAGALLFRPDGYVCWAADDAAACEEGLLAAVAAHLGG
ncbi:FAD-dependent oxidoreductase [Streptomyces hygroscopicus]|uniref:FAD-dependent oxidoreductase n=1 Tax=Streptomyces hygroscopicus TaxID=1912 RepID=UPI000836DEED|nr:FAD-dependent oxidoreductase [Streptomyces hygroscopicus]GLV73119.1 3-(3-hydroxyphenyl)propionate hydroxylase [Streptomyces hygroscopicus subsp. hygroscopicus]